MNSQDASTMSHLLKELLAAEGEVAKAQTVERLLNLKDGQNVIHCSVAGLHLNLTVMGRDYMPKVVAGRQALLALLQKEAHDNLIACRSKVEGINFQIKRLATGSAA